MPRKKALTAYPFLEEIPERHLGRLDLSALAIPDAGFMVAKARLERELHAHVVIYRAGRKRAPKQKLELCRTLYAASLRESGLGLLRSFESLIGNGIVVAYAKPVRVRTLGSGIDPEFGRLVQLRK